MASEGPITRDSPARLVEAIDMSLAVRDIEASWEFKHGVLSNLYHRNIRPLADLSGIDGLGDIGFSKKKEIEQEAKEQVQECRALSHITPHRGDRGR
jgi:hypothetical protein